jgi:type IV pilus assembly protein PilC
MLILFGAMELFLLIFLARTAARREDGELQGGWQEKIPFDLYLLVDGTIIALLCVAVEEVYSYVSFYTPPYDVLLLGMSFALAVLVFAVLPMFERVYDNLTGSLLSSSYAYVLAATLIGRISLVFAGLLGIVLLVLAFGIRSDKGREKLRNTMETSHFTRKAAWLLAVSEVMDTLSALLASGTDEDSALALCIEQTRHKKLHEALEKCREETQMGVGVATAFAHQKILPAMYGKMLLGGAQSGELVQVTENLARRTAQEAENGLCSVIDRTEPILIGFLTASVGLTLLSVMLPLLGILSAI